MTHLNSYTAYSNVVVDPSPADLVRVLNEKWPFYDAEKVVNLILEEATLRDAKITRTYTIPSYVAVEHAPALTPGKITVLAYVRKTLVDFRTPSALNFDDTGPKYRRVPLSGYMHREYEKKVDYQVKQCNTCYMTIPQNTDCPLCD